MDPHPAQRFLNAARDRGDIFFRRRDAQVIDATRKRYLPPEALISG